MDDLVVEIDEVVNKVAGMMNSGAPVHPEQYTNEGLKLAILKQRLGRKKGDAKRTQLVTEKHKFAEAREAIKGVTAQKEWVRLETIDQRMKFETVETEHFDLGKIIDMVRSHASAIKEEK